MNQSAQDDCQDATRSENATPETDLDNAGASVASPGVDAVNEVSVEQLISPAHAELTQRTFDKYLSAAIGDADPLRGALGLINSYQMRLASTYSKIL